MGLGKGKYGPVEGLKDKAGVPVVHHPKEFVEYGEIEKEKQSETASLRKKVASFGSWPALVDWDGDGDLDLLIGSFGGEIFLRENVGTRRKPEYAPETVRLDADGKPLKVNSHAAPAVADWDGDGVWDLVVGVSDGSVVWFRNEGAANKPRFGEARELVAPKSKDKFLTQYLQPGQAVSPGVRAQICVTDYDGDGRLDLLVGDFSRIIKMRKLEAKELAAFHALCEEEAGLRAKAADAKADSPEEKALDEQLAALKEKKGAYYADPKAEKDPFGTLASHVWLYRRAPKK